LHRHDEKRYYELDSLHCCEILIRLSNPNEIEKGKVKGKSKVYPITDHEGPEGE